LIWSSDGDRGCPCRLARTFAPGKRLAGLSGHAVALWVANRIPRACAWGFLREVSHMAQSSREGSPEREF